MQAIDAASYFIKKANEKSENDLTNLKLQKILYFAQGTYLGKNGVTNPLFPEPIEAWQLGPVVRDVYNIFSVCGASPITELDIPDGGLTGLSKSISQHLDSVWEEYGKYSASYLVDMTHKQTPWRDHYQPSNKNTIPISDMASCFAS